MATSESKARVIYLCVNYLIFYLKQTIISQISNLKIDSKNKITRQLLLSYRLTESTRHRTITYLLYFSSSSTSYGVYSSQTRSQVIKQQGLLFIYTNVYMLVKMFDQLIDQALTRSPVKRAHSHTIHQVFTRNNVQHETTFTVDDIRYTGSLFDWETNIQGRKFIVYIQTS